MPIQWRFKLSGVALILGGITASICHLFNLESLTDVSQLRQYARFGEPVHLVLFASGIVVLLAWFELYSLQCPDPGIMGFVAFICLFPGILCGDLLHCVLEFSVFPVLSSMVPYALPGIADDTYHSAALAHLVVAGQCLMSVAVAAMAISTYRSRLVPTWPAVPLALSSVLLGFGLFPQVAATLSPASAAVFYVSIAMLGISILSSARANSMRSRKVLWAKSAGK